MSKAVIFVEDSSNEKIASKKGKVCATYAPIKQSCPNSCKLKNTVCYAQTSYVGILVSRMEKEASGKSPEQIARLEAKAIDDSFKGKQIPQDGARGGRDLRIHVSGDARTKRSVIALMKAAKRFVARGGGSVWSYTHAFKTIPRKLWGSAVSVLASVENTEDAKTAREQGYTPAIVVPSYPNNDKAFYMQGSDTKWIPCPATTKDNISCADCRLCMNADKLYAINAGIAFAAHGARKKNLLKVIY